MQATQCARRGGIVIWISLLVSGLPSAVFAGDPANGDLSKNDPLDIRVMSYNHHADFIADPSRDAAFNRILTAIDPDIICFQEFPTSVSESDVANRMDSILPTPGGWQVHFGKLGGVRSAIVSRYPLLMTRTDTIPASSTRGVTIALVDLPDATYTTDVYVLGVHLKCCGDPGGSEDASRQDSTDAITNWLGDARGVSRPSGNNVVLPADTPMIVLGDFNFVGGPQPELTLRNGDIQDEGTYGPDVKGDWDVSDMFDVHPIDASSGDDFTWQGSGSFPPSRLDRFYITDSVVTIGENFVLNTDTMSSAALANAGLQASDTLPSSTSDHLPIVMDLQLAGGGCPDSDGDGVCDPNDICPGGNDNIDTDGDGVPDFCDPCPLDNPDDSDGDGVCDSADICPGGDDNIDTDGDGVPDFCDPCPLDNPDDSDGDGVCDSADICPGGDDNIDTDGDGVPDFCDVCPNDPLDLCDCPGDLDGDNDVDLADLAVLLSNFDLSPANPGDGDIDGDGDVDLADLAILLSNFDAVCP